MRCSGRLDRSSPDEPRQLALPMLSDTKRDFCGQLGILDESDGVAQRATFIVDPNRMIRFVHVTDPAVSRDPEEVLRVVSDLQEARPL